ncbi:hypothetical protein MPLDJ20_210056 [Mesorhizobium plurifarium]|uniref:Uncharacterized protein n=1 Tax=Mesorhizobium plurifarium TaxID=69974 RepID=A0A090F817_MESPL|nr:hypothetical protein MPLDJ20_210056 [Mesorhizobium plurifarium]
MVLVMRCGVYVDIHLARHFCLGRFQRGNNDVVQPSLGLFAEIRNRGICILFLLARSFLAALNGVFEISHLIASDLSRHQAGPHISHSSAMNKRLRSECVAMRSTTST